MRRCLDTGRRGGYVGAVANEVMRHWTKGARIVLGTGRCTGTPQAHAAGALGTVDGSGVAHGRCEGQVGRAPPTGVWPQSTDSIRMTCGDLYDVLTASQRAFAGTRPSSALDS